MKIATTGKLSILSLNTITNLRIKQITSLLSVLCLAAILTQSCSSSSDKYEDEIHLVMTTLPEDMQSNLTYKAAELKGGIAVGCYSVNDYDKKDVQMVFWVKDGVVYAGNGSAQSASTKELEYAPAGIDFSSIEAALKKVE